MTAKKAPAPKKAAAKKAPSKVAADTKARPVGRPSEYCEEYAEQARKLCLLGATDRKLADFFGVSEPTLNAWKVAHPEFLSSIREGKEIADAEIASALFHRAKGYSHVEDDIKVVAQGNNAGSAVVITPTMKHYPPDTNAASLWLRNRQPELWRDKVQQEISGPNGAPQEVIQHTTTPATAEDAYRKMLDGKA